MLPPFKYNHFVPQKTRAFHSQKLVMDWMTATILSMKNSAIKASAMIRR